MPFNGSGTFTRNYSWTSDQANGVPMQGPRFDADANDIASALSNCVTRDGQGYFQADVNANGYRLKNLSLGTVGAPSLYPVGGNNTGLYFPTASSLALSTAGVNAVTVDASQNASFAGQVTVAGQFNANGSTAIFAGSLTVNGSASSKFTGNVGVGALPSAWNAGHVLQVGPGSADGVIWSSGNDTELATNGYYQSGWLYQSTGYAATRYVQSGGQHEWFSAPSGTAGAAITWAQTLTLNAAGNLGLGIVPSGWTYGGNLELAAGSLSSANSTTNLHLGQNEYGGFYTHSAAASRYEQAGGAHLWYTAPSGTAGTAITFLQAMTLDVSGNLSTAGKATAGADATAANDLVRLGQMTGRLLNVQVISASGTYTPTAGTKSAVVDLIGGGGGSGWCGVVSAGQAAASGAGAAGLYLRAYIPSGVASTSVTVGAGGAAGVYGTSAATAGGTTSFGTLLSVGGGAASTAVVSTAPPFLTIPVSTPSTYTVNSPAQLVILGSAGEQPGGAAIALTSSVVQAGFAAQTPLGLYGRGAYGVVGSSSSGTNGTAGSNGVIIVYEYA